MIYILAEIFNYRQLAKINEELLDSLVLRFNEMVTAKKCKSLSEHEGLYLINFGSEQVADPKSIGDSAFHIYSIFHHYKNDLFGFNIFISIIEESDPETVIGKIKDLYFSLETEGGIWATKKEKDFFSSHIQCAEYENVYRLTKKMELPQAQKLLKKSDWTRVSVVNGIFDSLTPQLNYEQEPHVIFISGPHGSGKSQGLYTVVDKLLGKRYSEYVPVLYTRFKKKSFSHPFINSLNVSFLKDVGKFLKPWQKELWKAHAPILQYLKTGGETEFCLDHLYEDFFIGYNLYISAYLEMARRNLFPGIFVCDDIEKYHPLTLAALYKLIRDHLKYHYFFPILLSSQAELPDELNKFQISHIEIKAIETAEIRQYTKTFFPGIEIPKKILKQTKEVSKGQIPLVFQYLTYFENTGRIKKTNKHYTFVSAKDEELQLPEAINIISWFINKNLNQVSRDILYIVYLSGGMLSTDDLYAFFTYAGFSRDQVENAIDLFSKGGLATIREYIYPAYPSLKKHLHDIMGHRGSYLKDTFIEFVAGLYQNNKISNFVLLFSFFFYNDKIGPAFELLESLIKRKLDERDCIGVKPFLNIKNIKLPPGTAMSVKVTLRMIILAGKLRCLMLEKSFEKSEKLIVKIKKYEKTFDAPSDTRGYLYLTLGKYYLARQDTHEAIENIKKALMDFQDFGKAHHKAEAYLSLAQAMFADGKLDNSIDYLNLSVKIIPENTHPYEQIRILAFSGITAFMQGNLSKSIFETERARTLARNSGRREWELFLAFFLARINFEFGLYNESQSMLYDCLANTTIYSIKIAQPTVYAWLARNFIYMGDRRTGIKLLSELAINEEVLFFLSEAYHFSSDNSKALETIVKIEKIKKTSSLFSNEMFGWEDGFSAVEGRCLRLREKGTALSMLIRAFKAYLLGLTGSVKEGIAELYNITRVEKSAHFDPYNHFYFYLYSVILQESKDQEGYDSLTILNKSLKQLQERASKTEDPHNRFQYLNDNYWNSRILAAARSKHLF